MLESFVNKESICNFAPQFDYRNNLITTYLIFNNMIVVPVKEGENIEKALKKFKRKFEKTGVVKELRSRQQYDKPSVLKRLKMERAVYVQKMQQVEE